MRVRGYAKFEAPIDFDTEDYPGCDWQHFEPNDLATWPHEALGEINSGWAELVDWEIWL